MHLVRSYLYLVTEGILDDGLRVLAKTSHSVVTILFSNTIPDIIFAVAPQMLFVTIWVALSGSCSINPPICEAASSTSLFPFLSNRVTQMVIQTFINLTVAESLPNDAC